MRISAFHAISMKELATSDAVCVHSDPRFGEASAAGGLPWLSLTVKLGLFAASGARL